MWGLGGDVETICSNTVDSFRNTTPKHSNHTLPWNIPLFKQLTSVVGMCDLGARWLTNDDLRARQCLHWRFNRPHLSNRQCVRKKKCCWLLLTGLNVFCCCDEFEPWFEHRTHTPPTFLAYFVCPEKGNKLVYAQANLSLYVEHTDQ